MKIEVKVIFRHINSCRMRDLCASPVRGLRLQELVFWPIFALAGEPSIAAALRKAVDHEAKTRFRLGYSIFAETVKNPEYRRRSLTPGATE